MKTTNRQNQFKLILQNPNLTDADKSGCFCYIIGYLEVKEENGEKFATEILDVIYDRLGKGY